MAYTHTHPRHNGTGLMVVDTDIGLHLRYGHDMPGYEGFDHEARAYEVHEALTTHKEWDSATEKREAFDMSRSSRKNRKKNKGWQQQSWDLSPRHKSVRKSVIGALADAVQFTPRKTWQELRAEKGVRYVEVTHKMLVEVTDDLPEVCFAAENNGLLPETNEDFAKAGTVGYQLELFYVGSFDFDHLQRQDRPRILDESFWVVDSSREEWAETYYPPSTEDLSTVTH